ncbi:hypothetical protein EV683_13510 [Crenobacter luteus]|uniref:Adhesin n=1 Tax=Crenobacter luteus TaxID=1452487 RepID=A0A161R751_9NEIS|nr:hypothetical protein [Crenobacter luteus]KZE32478.1 hypothetical protein AVW16_11480 [Crenobacter luteus]TCP08454.1 hypothetical protein EV683_13510 [Crenobacter luteus]
MARIDRLIVATLFGTTLLAGIAHADETQQAVNDPFAGLSTANQQSLSDQAGKKDIFTDNLQVISNNAEQRASVGNTSLQNSVSVTGANTIGQGAFAGMSGIGTVFQNSGNNVVMQSSTILNVSIR